MDLVALGSALPDAWDDVCRAGREGWFWQTRSQLAYARSLAGERLVAEVNLAVERDGRLVAVAPISVIQGDYGVEIGGVSGERRAFWPVFAPDLSASARRTAEHLVFEGYRQLATDHHAREVRLQSSPLAPIFAGAPAAPSLPNRHGYTTEARDSSIVDLRGGAEPVLAGMSKGHRSAIRAHMAAIEVRVFDGAVTDADFDAYERLHAADSGRVTRAPGTFAAMRSWVRAGEGLLVGGVVDGAWAGFVLLARWQRGAFYWSACSADTELPIGHVLLAHAMTTLIQTGTHFLELGLQDYGDTPGANPKLVNIGRFKRGFGGAPWPVYLSTLRP